MRENQKTAQIKGFGCSSKNHQDWPAHPGLSFSGEGKCHRSPLLGVTGVDSCGPQELFHTAALLITPRDNGLLHSFLNSSTYQYLDYAI